MPPETSIGRSSHSESNDMRGDSNKTTSGCAEASLCYLFSTASQSLRGLYNLDKRAEQENTAGHIRSQVALKTVDISRNVIDLALDEQTIISIEFHNWRLHSAFLKSSTKFNSKRRRQLRLFKRRPIFKKNVRLFHSPIGLHGKRRWRQRFFIKKGVKCEHGLTVGCRCEQLH